MFYFLGLIGFIHHLIDQYPLDRWNPYIKNVQKVRYYAWHLVRYGLTWAWLLPAYVTLQPFSLRLTYELEKSAYVYDILHLIYARDWMYIGHHLVTLWLLLRSQTDVMYPYGIQILYIMNMSSIPFHMARLSRHLTVRWEKPLDTLFLTSFGYFRVWKFTQLFWNHFSDSCLTMDIKCMLILLYLLQWVWFTGLAYRYRINYFSVKNETVQVVSFQNTFQWSIRRPFQSFFNKNIRGLKNVGTFPSIGASTQ